MAALQEKLKIKDSLRFIQDPAFKSRLINFNRRNIEPLALVNMKKYTANFNFTLKKMPKWVKALYSWVKMVEDYHKTAKEIEMK